MGVTTATLWVCGRCGAVSHVDGGVMPSWTTIGFCPGRHESEKTARHSLKMVLVVVPYA